MSFPDHKTLEAILAARYDYDTCDDTLKAETLSRYEKLADSVLRGTPFSRYQLAEALAPRYREYCKTQRMIERRKQP